MTTRTQEATMTQTTTETITEHQIQTLCDEAAAAGDTAQVRLCEEALCCLEERELDHESVRACVDAINDATAQDETHATPTTDSELWDMVLGPYETPATVLAEADGQGITPQDYLRSAVDDAIDQGLAVDDRGGDAFSRLCRLVGVVDG
jgi:hypothetical protein